jgi:hypothetical protein
MATATVMTMMKIIRYKPNSRPAPLSIQTGPLAHLHAKCRRDLVTPKKSDQGK